MSSPFDLAFRKLVLGPLRDDQEDQQFFRDNAANYDQSLRAKVLNRGQTPCSSSTLVLQYCYTYMYQHLMAYKRFLNIPKNHRRITDKLGSSCCFVDVGCGPLTSALAMADHNWEHRPEDRLLMNYIGIDCEGEMIRKAREFPEFPGIFAPDSRFEFLRCGVTPDDQIPNLIDRLRENNYCSIILNFAYYWGQNRVRDLSARAWADCLKRIRSNHNVTTVYLNTTIPGHQECYDTFCDLAGIRKGSRECKYTFWMMRRYLDEAGKHALICDKMQTHRKAVASIQQLGRQS